MFRPMYFLTILPEAICKALFKNILNHLNIFIMLSLAFILSEYNKERDELKTTFHLVK